MVRVFRVVFFVVVDGLMERHLQAEERAWPAWYFPRQPGFEGPLTLRFTGAAVGDTHAVTYVVETVEMVDTDVV